MNSTKTAWILYNRLQQPQDWRFFSTKTDCQKEIDRIFRGMSTIKELGKIKPVKVTLTFEL